MHWTLRLLCFLPFAAVLLVASDSAWKERPISQWDEQDAKQVLAESPWVKRVTPQWVPDLTPTQCREAGDWSGCTGKGVGLAGMGLFGAQKKAEAIKRAHAKPPLEPVVIRWESALPIRAAERKVGETDVPALDNDHYAIVVYNMPTPKRWNLARELKGVALLKRNKKKDLKPSRVAILPHSDGTANLVYLFPSSVEIGKRDGRLEFRAQIGRLFVSQYFYTDEMQLQGNLELLMPLDGGR